MRGSMRGIATARVICKKSQESDKTKIVNWFSSGSRRTKRCNQGIMMPFIQTATTA